MIGTIGETLHLGWAKACGALLSGGQAPSEDEPYFRLWSFIEDFEFFKQSKKPDNIPILILIVMLSVFTWMAFRQAFRNDRIISRLEKNPKLAAIHHRKWEPYHKSWPKKLHVWPYLLRIEFIGALVVFAFAMVWSLGFNAPTEEPSNPAFTPNPSKAPWYFLGLQELLVYFDPWIAGVVLPGVIVVGLMAIPYIDVDPKGNGYYTWKQRRFAIFLFLFGFIALWVGTVFLGTYMRGPGWLIFMPWEKWDPHYVVHQMNLNLNEFFGVPNAPSIRNLDNTLLHPAFWIGAVGFFGSFSVLAIGSWVLFKKFKNDMHMRMSMIQLITLHTLNAGMFYVVLKIGLRLAFNLKYVWVIPGVLNI
jgi:hypothetical protein